MQATRGEFHRRLAPDINVSLGDREVRGPLADITERLHALVWRFDVVNVCFGANHRTERGCAGFPARSLVSVFPKDAVSLTDLHRDNDNSVG